MALSALKFISHISHISWCTIVSIKSLWGVGQEYSSLIPFDFSPSHPVAHLLFLFSYQSREIFSCWRRKVSSSCYDSSSPFYPFSKLWLAQIFPGSWICAFLWSQANFILWDICCHYSFSSSILSFWNPCGSIQHYLYRKTFSNYPIWKCTIHITLPKDSSLPLSYFTLVALFTSWNSPDEWDTYLFY